MNFIQNYRTCEISENNLKIQPNVHQGKLWQFRKKTGLFEEIQCILNNHWFSKIRADQLTKSFSIKNAFLCKYDPYYIIMCPYPYFFTFNINGKIKTFVSKNKQEIDEWFNKFQRWCFLRELYKDFEIIDKIGCTHNSYVMKLKSKISGKLYAGKLITSKEKAFIKTVLPNEIKINRDLDHPNIPCYHTTYIDDGNICLIFDLVEGPDLLCYLKTNGPLEEEKALMIMKSLLDILLYLKSKNIIHNDIKLKNILVASKDSIPKIKLIDFGLSTYIHKVEISAKCSGTIGYIAPEVLKGDKYDYKADIFGAGIVFYSLLTQRLPFIAKLKKQNELSKFNYMYKNDIVFPEHVWNNISKQTRNLVVDMTMQDPSLRISAEEALNICSITKESIHDRIYDRIPLQFSEKELSKPIANIDESFQIKSIFTPNSNIIHNIENDDESTIGINCKKDNIQITCGNYIMKPKVKPK